MKHLMRKLASLVLALILVFGMIPALSAEANSDLGVAINETNFPDDNFRQFIQENYDADEDWYLSDEEINEWPEMDLSFMDVADLTGIEFFPNLECLDCNNNLLTSLDVSSLTKLEYLFCNANPISSLDLSNNPALITLDCSGCELTSLDLSNNRELVLLTCSDNDELNTLDITKNQKLNGVECWRCGLTDIKISKNVSLEELDCFENELTSLDLTGCAALRTLKCNDNLLKSLQVHGLWYLRSVDCSYNKLTSLNLEGCNNLYSLDCYFNQLTSLDFSTNPYVELIDCQENQLKSLNLNGCSELRFVNCSNNKLTSLNVSTNAALESLYCTDNELTSLNVKKNPELDRIACENNALTSLDLSKNAKLIWLTCENNQLTALDISNNPYLIQAYEGEMVEEGHYKYVNFDEGYLVCILQVGPNVTIYKNITAKPSINTQPKNQTVAVGKKATFSVEATGAMQYQWYYRTSSDGEWKAVSAAAGKTASYSFTTAARHNGYQYRCRLSNSLGGVYTATRTLTVVTEKPSVTTQPKNQTVAVGDKATFTVKASGEALSYQWYYRTSSDGAWKAVSSDAGKKASYSLTAAARHNGYQYRCKITNPVGSIYSGTRTLTVVTAKPAITTQPSDKSVTAGKTVTFTVKASGEGLSYQWYYRKNSSGTWTAVSSAEGKKASYSFTTAARHNGYQYRCKVTNLLGSVYTKIVKLTVK